MAYGEWKIDEEATFNEFGYFSSALTKGSTKPVKCVCLNCGLVANKRIRESIRKHLCKSIIDGKKKCFKCKLKKDVDEFAKNRSTFDGYSKVCKDCFKNYDATKRHYRNRKYKYRSNLLEMFKSRLSNLRSKSIKNNFDFDLDAEYLLNLYEKQNGNCYYSGIKMKRNLGCSNYDSISVDRLDPNKGYVKSNIVLSSFVINSFKGMMDENQFKEFLNQILPKLNEYINRK